MTMPNMSMATPPFSNLDVLEGANACASLQRIIRLCEEFARHIPCSESAQAKALTRLTAAAGEEIRSGALQPIDGIGDARAVIRLYKAATGDGRLKLQLFPLSCGSPHPPHAHYNLISCQIVMRGRVRMREYSLLRRLPGNLLEISEEPEKILEKGEGVYTLQKRNNIHWQEGLAPGTLLLNINWQGYFTENPMAPDHAENGRCYIDWDKARPADGQGRIIVPEIMAE